MAEILDSGMRREFESGAVRDTAEGKGRCDLHWQQGCPILLLPQGEYPRCQGPNGHRRAV